MLKLGPISGVGCLDHTLDPMTLNFRQLRRLSALNAREQAASWLLSGTQLLIKPTVPGTL